MFIIGCHQSSSAGFLAMGRQMLEIGANTCQYFTRNPRGAKAKEIDPQDVSAFLDLIGQANISYLIAHAPYTLNACAAEHHLRQFTTEIIADDLARMEMTPGNYYNFHPGFHVNQGIDIGISQIAETLNKVLKADQNTTVLLETLSGKGSEVGGNFEQLHRIIDQVDFDEKLGICLDTCHVWDSGYDIVNNLDGVLTEFDEIIGIGRLKAIHLNDSKNPLGSHKDRHAKIGEGEIGIEGITRIINHPALQDLPFCLETPNDIDGYAEEIKLLKSLRLE